MLFRFWLKFLKWKLFDSRNLLSLYETRIRYVIDSNSKVNQFYQIFPGRYLFRTMISQGNIWLGILWVRELTAQGNILLRNCVVCEMLGWESVQSGKCSLGNCLLKYCQSGRCQLLNCQLGNGPGVFYLMLLPCSFLLFMYVVGNQVTTSKVTSLLSNNSTHGIMFSLVEYRVWQPTKWISRWIY